MLAGGLAGTNIGVDVVKLLRSAGLFELVVSLTYVIFLGIVGTLILVEGVNASRQVRVSGASAGAQVRSARLDRRLAVQNAVSAIEGSTLSVRATGRHRHVRRLHVGNHGHPAAASSSFRR